jgi:hypothetical protein
VQNSGRAKDRYGSLADIAAALPNVCKIRKLRAKKDRKGVKARSAVASALRQIPAHETKMPISKARKEFLREAGSGISHDSSDRSAMIEVFGQRFPGLSKRELGKLFDKYRLSGCIDIEWNAETGQYKIIWMD